MMGFRSVVALSLVALLGVAPGCGVIFGYGGPQPVQINIAPEDVPDAMIFADGQKTDIKAPGVVHLHPKAEHTVEVRAADGRKGQTAITKRIRLDIVLLDILTVGIGHLVDYLSGSLYALNNAVTIPLGKYEVPPVPTNTNPPPQNTGPDTSTTNVLDTPCPICGEPRGNVSPCPHCGMD